MDSDKVNYKLLFIEMNNNFHLIDVDEYIFHSSQMSCDSVLRLPAVKIIRTHAFRDAKKSWKPLHFDK